MPWTYSRKPCVGCGGPKPPGRGQRYCATCERKPHRPVGERTPCHACGSVEDKQPNKHFCDECLQLRQWRREKRRQAAKVVKRKACGRCGGMKGSGRGKRLCDKCQAEVGQLPSCRRCGERPVRRRYAQLCAVCAEESLVNRRARHRESYYRQRAKDPDGWREKNREKARKRHADPDKRARDLERRRLMRYLKAHREGRTVRRISPVAERPQASLPGAPLAAAIDRLARSEASVRNPFATWDKAESGGYFVIVCERAGVSERRVTGWRTGESNAWISTVDEVLTRLGLFWWEVWTEETVRRPFFVVHTYAWKWKKQRNKLNFYRVRVRSVPYGDAGPDLDELSRIESLMVGEAVAA